MSINYLDACSLIDIAESKYIEFKTSGKNIRFGQVLWFVLPDSVARSITNTEFDFYELTNKKEVIELFFKGCVEGL